ncbi:hypothetical protein [Streptomyces sp. NPDC046332]|uniref:hypothetical protein n=1 Tax=Streptomyces sp. NPDC046332 TaxID=3155133 RepID=UPI0033CE95A2
MVQLPSIGADENGAVVAASAGGELAVDADHTRAWHLRLGKSVDQAQDGGGTRGMRF